MSTVIHVSQSVDGALRNWRASNWRNVMRDTTTGRYLTPAEVKSYFIDLLSQGIRLLPLGECPGHDPIKGCPGHECSEK